MKIIAQDDWSDEQLILEIKIGNRKALNTLCLRYYKMIYCWTVSFSRNETHASDLTQDIFLKVIEQIGSYRGEAKFSTWLYSITFHYCIDQIRRNKHSFEKLGDHLDPGDDSMILMEETLEEEQKEEKAREVIGALPQDEKHLLLLKYEHQKSIEELQEIYHLSASAVKMRLKRAREKASRYYLKSSNSKAKMAC